MKKIIPLLLLLALLLSACQGGVTPSQDASDASQPSQSDVQEPEVSWEFNTEQPSGLRESAVSLNGQWELFVDGAEKTNEYKNDDGTGAERVSLTAEPRGVRLTVSKPEANDYFKARALVLIEEGAVGENGADIALRVRVNGGEWRTTEVSYYQNGQQHWVDLDVDAVALTEGENLIELSSNAADGVWLLSDGGEGYSLRLRSATCGDSWTEVQVPSAAEGQFEVSYADRVFPDTFNGIVWYKKTFTVDDLSNEWWLCFNAVDYRAEVWLNGHFLGSHENGYTGFRFPVAASLVQGENTLVVRVVDQDWNSGLTEDDIHIKETLAGFTQDTRKLNYCGIWQSVYLEPRGSVAVDDIYVSTLEAQTGALEVQVTLRNPTDAALETTLSIAVDAQTEGRTVTVPAGGRQTVPLPLTVASPKLWTADEPNLYSLTATAEAGGKTDTLTQRFGIRTTAVEGRKVLVNGEPVFLTGMLHWGSYYENYTSAVAAERVRYEITELQKAGFNAIKYCLFSPPDYVLDLCDELGMYVYIEYPIWNVNETDAFFERAYLQMMEMVEKDRSHPCVVMSDFNCEDLEFTEAMDELMRWCVETAKTVDPGRLFTDNSTNGEHKYGDFATCHPYYQADVFETMLAGWLETRGEQPLILGEYADISVLRDINELNAKSTEQYTWYHDYYQEIDQGTAMREAGYTEEQIDTVIQESVQNAQEMRKYYLEASKAHEGVAGLFLTHIFESPNGWADGWFDDLYKPHFDADYIKMSAGENALLLPRESSNLKAGQEQTLTPAVSLYGGADVTDGELRYELLNGETSVLSGTAQTGIALENGNYYEFAPLTLAILDSDSAVRYTLRLTLLENGETVAQNEWSLWGCPLDSLDKAGLSDKKIQVYDPSGRLGLGGRYPWMTGFTNGTGADLVVASEMNGMILNYLTNGGKVVYVGSNSGVTQVKDNWDYNRFSFAYAPDPENALAASLQNGGFGGMQFINLATATYLAAADNGTNLIGRFGITTGEIASYVCDYQIGQGSMLQTTLRLDASDLNLGGALLTHESLSAHGENVLGAYLLDQMIRYQLEK